MISMTTYWRQFQDCINTLQEQNDAAEYSKQIRTAKRLIEVGLTIETLGITEIKQVANKLQDLAKFYNNEVLFKAPDKEYRFNLPKIVDANSLIFAINYYQHLSNYEQVSYQGSISFLFKGLVASSINEKKTPTRYQSKAMLAEINNYCTNQNIELNEALLLKKNDETAQEYTSRLVNMVTPATIVPAENKQESAPSDVLDELVKLQQGLENIKTRKTQIKIIIDAFSKKQSEYNQAKQQHQNLNDEWQNKWLVTRVFYQFISWFFEVPLLKNIKNAKEQFIQVESELNEQIPPNQTAESYSSDLILQVRKLNNEFSKTEDQITQYHELKQKKQNPPKKTNESEPVVIKKAQTYPAIPKPVPQPSNMDFVYGFFNHHRQLVQATAVAAVAIVVQNLVY